MDRPTAIGYVRVSTEEQVREGVSVSAQESKIRAYADLHGLNLVAVYRDEGVSAGKPLASRPSGVELLARIKGGEAGHVIAMKLDRLFRDAVDCLQTAREWDAAGIAMHLIDLGGQTVNTGSAMGRFFMTVMAGAAEMERNLVRERTAAALAHKRDRGERLGTTPLGFVTPEPGAEMEPVPDELEAVRFILRRREGGATYQAIADALEDAGHPTKRGGQWHPATVRAVWKARERYAAILGEAA